MIDDIHDDSVRKVERGYISPVSDKTESDSKVDSSASTIEKSKSVRPEVVPPIDIPILSAPSNQESVSFVVASIDSSGKIDKNTIHSFVLKGEEIKNSALKKWSENLREIEEQVRQLLASPAYQQLQEIRRKGDPSLGSISGIQTAVSANAAVKKGEGVELLSTIDRAQVLERIPPTAEIPDTTAPQDASKVLILPLTAALLAGIGFGAGAEAIQAVNPVELGTEIIQRLQPLFSVVNIRDIVPLINLMVVGPLYFNSWNEAVNNLTTKELKSHVPAIQNFARDAIKIAVDPRFVNVTLINSLKGSENLSDGDRDRLARMLKVVLIGVALSLLYSSEVGKVQKGKFGGMESEELRDLLLGKMEPEGSKPSGLQEELTGSLIRHAWEQLESLSVEDRTVAVEMLLTYVNQKRDIDPMLDPAKVFEATIASGNFNPKEKIGMIKG